LFLGEQAYFVGLVIAYLVFAGALAFGMITSSRAAPPRQDRGHVDSRSTRH
jgi:hypothetical protein